MIWFDTSLACSLQLVASVGHDDNLVRLILLAWKEGEGAAAGRVKREGDCKRKGKGEAGRR